MIATALLWKTTCARRGLALVAAALALPLGLPAGQGPAPVNLRSATHFTVLAGAAVTTTGGGVIDGDVGTYPITGAAIHLTAAQVNGTIYSTDAAGPAGSVIDAALLLQAKSDLTTAYNDAAGRQPFPVGPFLNPGAGNIGGLTLIPGLYKFTGTASIAGSDVTLTGGADDVWIFQVASDLQVGSGRSVILAGGAQARNIYWQVGTSATIGTFAAFKGNILADQAITMNTSSTMDGRALARTAGVTFNGDGGDLPTPARPFFLDITQTTNGDVTLTLATTPYFTVTLESSPDLSLPDWTILTTVIPELTPWTFVHQNARRRGAPQLFYRATLTPFTP